MADVDGPPRRQRATASGPIRRPARLDNFADLVLPQNSILRTRAGLNGRVVMTRKALVLVALFLGLFCSIFASRAEAKVSFLEAALFFLTGVEATNQDYVTDNEIRLSRYPIVAYTVPGNPCAVRLRYTDEQNRGNTIWQMDFCKITSWRWYPGMMAGYYWIGKPDAFCYSRTWKTPDNYMHPEFSRMATGCGSNPGYGAEVAYAWMWDIGVYVGKGPTRNRDVDRMIASYRYLQWLWSGEEPKPY